MREALYDVKSYQSLLDKLGYGNSVNTFLLDKLMTDSGFSKSLSLVNRLRGMDKRSSLAKEANNKIVDQLISFIKSKPYPTDDEFHAFAESQGHDEHRLEEVAYGLLSDIFTKGKADEEKPKPYNLKELALGKKVELEHTSSPQIAEEIAKDHLQEMDNYYTELEKMESGKLAKVLTTKGRKHIAPSNFVYPKEKKFPIHDLAHAKNALSRAHYAPDPDKVRKAVYSKYPQLKKRKEEREDLSKKAKCNKHKIEREKKYSKLTKKALSIRRTPVKK